MYLRQAGCAAISFTLYKCEILQHTKSYEGILGNIMFWKDIHLHFHPAQISKSVLVQSLFVTSVLLPHEKITFFCIRIAFSK